MCCGVKGSNDGLESRQLVTFEGLSAALIIRYPRGNLGADVGPSVFIVHDSPFQFTSARMRQGPSSRAITESAVKPL
jgi:hypothetical protein